MENVLALLPLLLTLGLLAAKLAGKPLSVPMVLAPLALYALPLLLGLALVGGVLFAILRRLPGGKFFMGSVAALTAGAALWLRRLVQALRS